MSKYWQKIKALSKKWWDRMVPISKDVLQKAAFVNDELFKENENKPTIRKPLIIGLIIVVFFILGFLIWAALAPLESAAVASGRIVIDTNRKTIQHLEGGIIRDIYIREGSHVKQGDKLITLDTTQSLARMQLFQGQLNSALALEARLIAEAENAKLITYPASLMKNQSDPEVVKIITGQQEIFDKRRQSFNDNINILKERVEQLKNEIASLQSQEKSYDAQLILINEELKAVSYLAEKKYIDLPRLLALKREAQRLQGNRDEQRALIAQAEQKIGETQLQMVSLESDKQNKIAQDLRDTQTTISDLNEKLRSAQDVLQRTNIAAPKSGTVIKLNYHTIGGVIEPGQPILDLVPDDEPLIIEVRLNPLDIDVVHPGLFARIRLLAYKQRTMPVIDGKVIQVSPDAIQDEKTGESYYLARVLIDPSELKQLKNVQLYPGMPAQVLIVTAKRTPFQYLLDPIRESIFRAFREQ